MQKHCPSDNTLWGEYPGQQGWRLKNDSYRFGMTRNLFYRAHRLHKSTYLWIQSTKQGSHRTDNIKFPDISPTFQEVCMKFPVNGTPYFRWSASPPLHRPLAISSVALTCIIPSYIFNISLTVFCFTLYWLVNYKMSKVMTYQKY